MLSLLLRLLAFLAVLWLIRVLWKSLLAGHVGPDVPRRPGFRVTASELVKDPQCGVYVSPQASIKATSDNEAFYFCSAECREAFLKAHPRASS